MFCAIKVKKTAVLAVLLVCVLVGAAVPVLARQAEAGAEKKEPIKWVDFNIPSELLKSAMELDIETHGEEGRPHVDWIEILAYLGTKYGGDFTRYRSGDLEAVLEKIGSGQTVASLGEGLKYYSYYSEAYHAVLDGFVGEYEVETENGWEKRYGLKAYSPIAKTFPYSDYDDFGVGRSYGYQRRHLGHDLMAAVGTPVIAVESGVVEAMGWNQYGGWRIGIRSDDKKRYYYYAHLLKDHPFADGLQEGSRVEAGDVIGFMGRTGYSTTENVNNIEKVHLHFGLELIFDESQKECNSEIWIDVYDIVSLLNQHRSSVRKNMETGAWERVYPYRDLDRESST